MFDISTKLILSKLLLGVTLAAPIGPVNVAMIKRGLANGFFAAFYIRLGGVVANAICLVASFFWLSYLVDSNIMRWAALIGAVVLFYLGVSAIRDAWRNSLLKQEPKYKFGGLGLGFMLGITSPVGLMFWLSIAGIELRDAGDLLPNLFILLGVLLWGAIFSGILHCGRTILANQALRWISGLSGACLLYFAIATLFKAL